MNTRKTVSTSHRACIAYVRSYPLTSKETWGDVCEEKEEENKMEELDEKDFKGKEE